RDAGVIVDILVARMRQRGFLGLVTDGVVRDLSAVAATGLPIWAEGTTAPPSIAGLHYCESGLLIGCAGVAVANGDFVVADDDGGIVIPAALVEATTEAAEDKDHFESWVLSKVEAG